jgi:putative transposon-encoded protein
MKVKKLLVFMTEDINVWFDNRVQPLKAGTEVEVPVDVAQDLVRSKRAEPRRKTVEADRLAQEPEV